MFVCTDECADDVLSVANVVDDEVDEDVTGADFVVKISSIEGSPGQVCTVR